VGNVRGCSVVGDANGNGACMLLAGAPGPVTVASNNFKRTITQLCIIGRVFFCRQYKVI
jgi:hypothetical protein